MVGLKRFDFYLAWRYFISLGRTMVGLKLFNSELVELQNQPFRSDYGRIKTG